MFDILYKIHDEPIGWLSSMVLGSLDDDILANVARGCEVLANDGLTHRQIRSAMEQSPRVLDALAEGNPQRVSEAFKDFSAGLRYNLVAECYEIPRAETGSLYSSASTEDVGRPTGILRTTSPAPTLPAASAKSGFLYSATANKLGTWIFWLGLILIIIWYVSKTNKPPDGSDCDISTACVDH